MYNDSPLHNEFQHIVGNEDDYITESKICTIGRVKIIRTLDEGQKLMKTCIEFRRV